MALGRLPKALIHIRHEMIRRRDSDLEQTFPNHDMYAPASTYPGSRKHIAEDSWSDIEKQFEISLPSLTSPDSALAMGGQGVKLPDQRYRYGWMNKWRWQGFLTYHRLNAFIVTVNLAFIVAYAIMGGALWKVSVDDASTAIAANVLLAVLVRNELVVNLLFLVFGCTSQRLPLRLRCIAAKIYHYGGSHSGGAFSAALWLLVFNINLIYSTWTEDRVDANRVLLATTMLIDILMLVIIGTSMPSFRRKHHNVWECIHRYGGWSLLILFWAQFGVTTHTRLRESSRSVSWTANLIQSSSFWMLLLITLCIIWPWLRLRKVKVNTEVLSDHAVRLHFDYTNIAFCVAPRLSDNPWREWHSFAAIPHPDGFGYSVLMSKSGDWTTKIVRNPPKQLWIRSIPIRGVLHVAPIFKSMVLVATGSGIGPVLSLLYARKVKCRILWSTKDPRKTYQDEVYNQVLHADSSAVIIDTTAIGRRPNLLEEAYKLYRELDAEAVFVISNPSVSTNLVYNLESRGVPCFAPIFDS